MDDQRLQWLRPKMDSLFVFKAKQEAKGIDFNTSIQAGREYRNPRICEKLIESCNIKQYGSNFPKEQFDPDSWNKKEDYYNSAHFERLVRRREEQRQQQQQHQQQQQQQQQQQHQQR